MESDHEIKTRVTTLEELRIEQQGDDCLVVIYSPNEADLGRRHVLTKRVISVGRDRDNDIVLDSDSVSRRHCRVEHRDGHVFVLDLDSTNGTFVNDDGEPVTEMQLRKGDHLKVGDSIFKFLAGSDVEAQYHEAIFKLTITDGLTDIGNIKHLKQTLEKEIPRANRHGRDLSLLMMDIDHFKAVNDTYGHLAGDSVLRDLAHLTRDRLRPDDVFGRYGGEEFCAILPETSLEGSAKIAEDLRARIEEHAFTVEGEVIQVTISIGIADLRKGMDLTAFFKCADEQLYRAKHAGRNRVCWSGS